MRNALLWTEERVRTDAPTPPWSSTRTGKAQGWAHYGAPDELSAIKHRLAYEIVGGAEHRREQQVEVG